MYSKWDRLVAGLKAYHAADLDAALDLWDEAATVRLVGAPPGGRDAFNGKAEVRLWLAGLLAEHFEIQEELVREDGDTVIVTARSWSDATRGLGVAPLVATEVYVFEGTRVRSMTWTISPDSSARLKAALGSA